MRPVLRRIAIHGVLTAVVLGVVGLMFAELASIWLAGSPGTRAATATPVESPDADGAVSARLRSRVPLAMAVWGFGFVAVGETLLYAWRARRPAPPPPQPQPDETEKLLLELLAQAEAAARQEAGDGSRVSGVEGQEPGTPPVGH